MSFPRWQRAPSVALTVEEDTDSVGAYRSVPVNYGRERDSPLLIFTPEGTPAVESSGTTTEPRAWRTNSSVGSGSGAQNPIAFQSSYRAAMQSIDCNVLGQYGLVNAFDLNNGYGRSTTTEQTVSDETTKDKRDMLPPDAKEGHTNGDRFSKTKTMWRQSCEASKTRLESQRALYGFKDRLADERVLYRMRELWTDAVEYHGRHWKSIDRMFLLSVNRFYHPTPIATLRLTPEDGKLRLRKDVRVILTKGMCRTEKKALRQFHSLISFKYNDIVAMFAEVLPNRPLMVLFFSRYEGAVVFWFQESEALRVILVLMQTRFVEQLQCHIPENSIGRYAGEVLKFCAELKIEDREFVKDELVETALIRSEWPTFFENLSYPETDGWEDDDSDSDESPRLADFLSDEMRATDLHGLSLGTKRRRRLSINAEQNMTELPSPPQNKTPLTEEFLSTTHRGELEFIRDQDNVYQEWVATKKQREEKKLERMILQKIEQEEEIEKQQKLVSETMESVVEIEDRISRLSVAIGQKPTLSAQ